MCHVQSKKVLNGLAKINGHVKGIYEMIEAERACPDVIVQLVAVRSALNKVAQIVLVEHLEHCLVDVARSDDFELELANFDEVLNLLI